MPKQWSEADYKAAGYITVKLRLPPDVGKALTALTEMSSVGRAELISQLILKAFRKSEREQKKDPTKP